MKTNEPGWSTGVRGAALWKVMVLALMPLAFPHGLPAEKVQITCSFELPCEFAWNGGSVIVYYRNVDVYTVVVDRMVNPCILEAHENDLFRFVILVDMHENKVIVTTYDKDSGNTLQMETSLDSLCKVPMKGAQYIPFLDRPQMWILRAGLFLDDPGSPAGLEYRGIIADLGLTEQDVPEAFAVVRQGIALRCTAERLPDGAMSQAEQAGLSP
jgi:hypothetical protein